MPSLVSPGVSDILALSAPVQTYRFNTNHPVLKVLTLTPRQGTPMRAHKRPPEVSLAGRLGVCYSLREYDCYEYEYEEYAYEQYYQ